jgi:hypothetical protein
MSFYAVLELSVSFTVVIGEGYFGLPGVDINLMTNTESIVDWIDQSDMCQMRSLLTYFLPAYLVIDPLVVHYTVIISAMQSRYLSPTHRH